MDYQYEISDGGMINMGTVEGVDIVAAFAKLLSTRNLSGPSLNIKLTETDSPQAQLDAFETEATVRRMAPGLAAQFAALRDDSKH